MSGIVGSDARRRSGVCRRRRGGRSDGHRRRRRRGGGVVGGAAGGVGRCGVFTIASAVAVVVVVGVGFVAVVVLAGISVGGIGAVLDVRRSEAVKLAAIFCVVDIVFEEKFTHAEKSGAREKRIASGLMLRTCEETSDNR